MTKTCSSQCQMNQWQKGYSLAWGPTVEQIFTKLFCISSFGKTCFCIMNFLFVKMLNYLWAKSKGLIVNNYSDPRQCKKYLKRIIIFFSICYVFLEMMHRFSILKKQIGGLRCSLEGCCDGGITHLRILYRTCTKKWNFWQPASISTRLKRTQVFFFRMLLL